MNYTLFKTIASTIYNTEGTKERISEWTKVEVTFQFNYFLRATLSAYFPDLLRLIG